MTRSALLTLGCALTALGIGCASSSGGGGDDGSGGQAGKTSGLFGGGGSTAGTGNTTGGAGGNPTAGSGGSQVGGPGGSGPTGQAPTLVANVSTKKVKESAEVTAANLHMTAINLSLDANLGSPGTSFVEVFGRMYNGGSTIVCFGQATILFKKGSTVLWKAYSFAYGDPYDTGSKSSATCLAPGKFGGFYANGNENTFAIADVDGLEISYEGEAAPADAKSLASVVSLSNVTTHKAVSPDQLAVAGTVTVSAPIYNLRLNILPQSATKMPIGQLTAYLLDPIAAGDSVEFDTQQGVKGTFSEQEIYVQFIQGSPSSPLVGPSPFDHLSDAAAKQHEQARTRLTQRLAAELPAQP